MDAAMHLFSEQGFKATTIVQIESAAGLARGGGGLYRHFPSKEAILAAGIDRHLERLDALRRIRPLFADLGDLRIELTIAARYLLTELDEERELLRLLVTEARHHPDLTRAATDRLIGTTLDGFARWLQQHGQRPLDPGQARRLAKLTLGGLISSRLLDENPDPDHDEELVKTLVDLLLPQLQHPGPALHSDGHDAGSRP